MNKYIKYIELGFSDALYYRTSSILTFLSTFFVDYVKVSVWYGAITYVVYRLNQSMVNDTLLYMILVGAFSSIYRTQPAVTLSDAYLNGTLIHRRVYPISILISNFFESLGRVFARLIINVIPTLVILAWVFRPNWNYIVLSRTPMVLVNILVSLYFNYILFALIDVSCFWLKNTQPLQNIKEIVFKFLSGSLFPLWFLNRTFQEVNRYLPFSKQLYNPIAFLMGHSLREEFLFELGILCVYAIVFSIIVLLLWKKGLKRVESFGG